MAMDHDDLVAFIRDEMRMQHIYQPLLIKTLVECGGSATVRQLAQAVLALDESQLRYEALKRAGKRCELCGVEEGDSNYENRLPLHVDHIVQRSKGGSNDIENLQVLCRACNLGKGNRDDTDFRSKDG